MSTFRIEIGFDRKGVRSLRRGGKIYLPCGVARLQGAIQPILGSRCKFQKRQKVQFRIYDITTLIDHPEGGSYIKGVPCELRIEFRRSRPESSQPEISPITHSDLCLRSFRPLEDEEKKREKNQSPNFDTRDNSGTEVPIWDVCDPDTNELAEYSLLNPGGFLVTYYLRLEHPRNCLPPGECLSDPDECLSDPDLRGFQYVHDPEWVVGGGTGP